MSSVRSKIVVGLLVAMLAGFVALVLSRGREPHEMPRPVGEAAEVTDAAGPPAEPPGTPSASVAAGPLAQGPSAPASSSGAAPSTTKVLDRALTVVGPGWELLVPGLTANRGRTPGEGSVFSAAGLDVQLRSVDGADDVERQLARGGADANGADVALMPLPALVGAYERLRILEPEAFFVVGWSRGREALFGAPEVSLARPNAGVKTGDVRLLAAPGGAPLGLALFALDQVGVPLSRVRGVDNAKDAQLAALSKPFPPDRTGGLLLSTTDASRLVPIVLVAPHAFVAAHGKALEILARGWLEGLKILRSDVPAAARQVAQEEGAPEPATLLDRLGQIEWASAEDNARAFGLVERVPLPLAALFAMYWRLWRDVGLSTSPAPDTPPFPSSVVAAIGRGADPARHDAATTAPDDARGLLVARRPRANTEARVDEAALVSDVALLAGIFDRSVLRVSARAPGLARTVVERVLERYDIAPSRLLVGGAPDRGAHATIEVLAPR